MAAKFSNKFIGRKTSATLRKVKLIYAFVLSLVLRPGLTWDTIRVLQKCKKCWADSGYVRKINNNNKNLEEIQDQIAICAKREIKVQKTNKSLKNK